MSEEIKLPNLDDTTEDERLEEMKALIPIYTPEWTDHSMSEPGMGFLQLMVWLYGQVQYRLNQIPDKAYLAFLKMLGFALAPGEPARADLEFTLTGPQTFDLVIPAGTEVSTRRTESSPAVAFMTDQVLTIPRGELGGVVSATCTQYGKTGQVGANTITIMRDPIPYVGSVTNPEAATGGAEPEELESLKARAPLEIKVQDRAVASEDHWVLARRATESVGRAWTLPLYDPSLPDEETEGHTTVAIVPAGGGIAPLGLLQEIREYLDERRLTASRLHVISAELVEVVVDAVVVRKPGYTDEEVKTAIVDALDTFLDEEKWPAGRDVYLYELAAIIENTAGVDHVEKLSNPVTTIQLTKTQVTTPGSYSITIITD